MSSLNGQGYAATNGRDRSFGSAAMWQKVAAGIVGAAILGGAAMLLRHETALAVNVETIGNIKTQIADVKSDTLEIKRQLRDIGRDVRRNSPE